MIGKNRKSEILYIPYERLLLDDINPRLAGDYENKSQLDIISEIYEREELEELADSLSTHGFLPEEPVIVIAKESDAFDNINQQNISDYDFIVLEGNRRMSTVKLLMDDQLRADIDVKDNFPTASAEIRSNLSTIPAIFYKERKDVDAYLGIRHIAGNRKWDSYAKARYIFDKVSGLQKDGYSIEDAINQVKSQIGDRKDVIRNLYVYYKVFESIDEDILNYRSKHIKERFSLIQVALANGRTNIADFIGLKRFKDLDLSKDIVPTNKVENLKDVTQWIFGLQPDGSDKLISDSRKITSHLNPILGNHEALEFLKKHDDIESAYDLTNGEEELVKNNINKSYKFLSNILDKVSKYRDNPGVFDGIQELKRLVSEAEKLTKE